MTRRYFPGEWATDQIAPRGAGRPYFEPMPKLVEPLPIPPHTPWGRSYCNSSCRGKNGCGAPVGHVAGSAPGEYRTLAVTATADGAFVLEMDGFHRPVAVPYDAVVHAGWMRFAEHVCEPKGER